MTTEEQAPELLGRRVLVVEDEFVIADDLANALRRIGAVVVGPASSVAKARALLQAQAQVDVAILDIKLRCETVFALADTLRAAGVLVVFATGYDRTALPERFQDLPHWEKPFDFRALARILPALLDGTRPAARSGCAKAIDPQPVPDLP